MGHDAVFYGVVISVAGALAVMLWLFYVIVRNASRNKEK